MPTEPETFRYFVVAEERAARLAVLGLTDEYVACLAETTELCGVYTQVSSIELPHEPHNLASAGSVVYATHPRAGSLSRVNLIDRSVVTVQLGTEPHDVKYARNGDLLYVADEEGRRLLSVDPEDLAIVESVDLPERPHDLAIAMDGIWVTLIGTDRLARVRSGDVELIPTGQAPHDLIVDGKGQVWFSNWRSDELSILDPSTGEVRAAPAGVVEPHHFALDSTGAVWVSDNGGSSIVGFAPSATTIEVGPVPHHLVFDGETGGVAVSGSGQAVFVAGGEVISRVPLTTGLHGITTVDLATPLADG